MRDNRIPIPTSQALGDWLGSILGHPINVTRVAFSEAGMSNTTLFVETNQNGVSLPLVIKLLSSDSVVFRFDPTREYRFLEKLHQIGALVPRPLGLDLSCRLFDRPCMMMERAVGRSAPDDQKTFYMGSGWLQNAPPEERRRVWNNFIDSLADLHNRTDARDFPFGIHGDGSVAATIEYWREALADALRGRDAPIQMAALDWLSRHEPDLPHFKPAVCVGDARLQNTIFDGDSVSALVDFEIAHIGNPASDIGYALHLHDYFVRMAGGIVLEGIPTHEETWVRWSERTGQEASNTQFWTILGGIVIAVTATRAMRVLIEAGLMPADALDDESLNSPAEQLRPLLGH
jgi:aminoglycoside phosphotransferase (APT) family kinase protein